MTKTNIFDKVYRMSLGFLEGVWRVSGKCMLSRRGSGDFLDGVWNFNSESQELNFYCVYRTLITV